MCSVRSESHNIYSDALRHKHISNLYLGWPGNVCSDLLSYTKCIDVISQTNTKKVQNFSNFYREPVLQVREPVHSGKLNHEIITITSVQEENKKIQFVRSGHSFQSLVLVIYGNTNSLQHMVNFGLETILSSHLDHTQMLGLFLCQR